MENTRTFPFLFHLQLTEEVVRKKNEYTKHLDGYRTLRDRFEEHYIKGKNPPLLFFNKSFPLN